jgi:hypothetical protein
LNNNTTIIMKCSIPILVKIASELKSFCTLSHGIIVSIY